MDIKERLEEYLKKNNAQLPWPYGISGDASERANTIWNTLSQIEKLSISKHNPYGKDRNKIIHELHRRGIPQVVLVEMSGLSFSVVRFVTYKDKEK